MAREDNMFVCRGVGIGDPDFEIVGFPFLDVDVVWSRNEEMKVCWNV